MINFYKINNQIDQIFVQDNNSINTLVFIHGVNSNFEFARRVYGEKLNFNVIALNMPGSKMNLNNQDANYNEWIKYASWIMDNIKNSNIYLLCHSIGGAVAYEITKKYNCIETFLVNPIHPDMRHTIGYKILSLAHSDSVIAKKSITSLLKLNTLNNIYQRNLMDVFINPKSAWFEMIKENVINLDFLNKLNDMYNEIKDKTTFIVSEKDIVIDGLKLINYLEDNKMNFIKIGNDHNPFIKNSKEIVDFLNSKIPFKKRPRHWFRKTKIFNLKIIKNKK
ncbi:alpha/beta hydrolase [Mycoplasma elephantis]|uniref:alpha/beta hydrolase n=1 Tax=Mycoplasma elephantis TaxID=114882 RepID=UPI0012EB937A|nr:alpha/beta hydrolase [Mycoplasma elephantis]